MTALVFSHSRVQPQAQEVLMSLDHIWWQLRTKLDSLLGRTQKQRRRALNPKALNP